jgi:hypothetical protein
MDAHGAVYAALKSGELVRGPCEQADYGDCHGRIEGHHDDYSKPVDVRWLCSTHHRRLHAEKKRRGDGKENMVVRVRLTADLTDRMEAEMVRDDRTAADVVRRALRSYLPILETS